MPTASFANYPKFQADIAGVPASGALLFTYAAGTTTKQTTRTTPAGDVPNANPVVLDARGEANVCLDDGLLYKFVLAPSTDTDPPVAPIWTVDNVGMTSAGLLFTQTGAGAEATDVQTKLRAWLSVRDFMTAAEIAGCAAGTVNVTQALRDCYTRAAAIIVTHGRVSIDFENFVMQIFPETHIVDPATLFPFASADGVRLISSGAKFVCSGNITIDAVRLHIFTFSACNNIVFDGVFVGTYSGTRNVGGANTATAMYRRGLVFAKYLTTCIGVDSPGITVSDFSMGHWMHEETSVAVANGSRNFNLGHVKATRTGYPVEHHRSGHNITAFIDTDACGRSYVCQDVYGARVIVKSKDHDASNDCGFAGDVRDIDFYYMNTESTLAGIRGRCIGIHYDTENVTHMRNIKVRWNVKVAGSVYYDYVCVLGMAVGSTAVEIQSIAVDATGGTFTITYAGQTTSALAYNISTAAMTTALDALSNIAPGDVVVTGGVGNDGGTTPYILTWLTSLTGVAVPTTTPASLTGGRQLATVDHGTMENIDIGGTIVSPNNSQRGVYIEHPTTFADGTKLSAFKLRDYYQNQASLNAIDLGGNKDVAILENVVVPTNIQLAGNAVGKVICQGVKVDDATLTGDVTSLIDFYSCEITTGTYAHSLGKNYANTLIAGVRYNYNGNQTPRGRIYVVPISGAVGALGTSVAPVAGTLYVSEIAIALPGLYTGIGILNGATAGSGDVRILSLYNSAGVSVANTGGAFITGANVLQLVAFTAAYRVPEAGRYFIVAQQNSNTDTFRAIAAATYQDAYTISQAGTYPTLATLSPLPTAIVADVGPIAFIYK